MRIAFVAKLMILALLVAPPLHAAGLVKQRMAIFDAVWRTVRDAYYDPAFNGADWATAQDRYRPLAAGADSDAQFYTVLRQMLGELRDAHTRVLDPRQARERSREQIASSGLILFEVAGEPVVFAVTPGSAAADAGVMPGMRVNAIDGKPIREALADARAATGPSSSERAALVLSYLRLIAGPPGTQLRLMLERGDGTALSVALARHIAATTPRFESRRLPSGHGYIRFDRFDEPVARQFAAALQDLRGAPGLIIDLRANTGGDGKEGARTIGPLLPEPTVIARLATRTGKPPSALLGLVTLPLELSAGRRGGQIYAGPVAILVNQGTASTAEVIAASLQEAGRAIVIGTQSCGCALGVLRYRTLADGGALAISEVGLITAQGRRIEGGGVVPDLATPLSLTDLRAGRDTALAAAVARLSNR